MLRGRINKGDDTALQSSILKKGTGCMKIESRQIVSQADIKKIIQLNESVKGTTDYMKYHMEMSYKHDKRNVFTPESLSVILQDKLRKEAGSCFRFNVKEELSEKKQGRNHDLSVMEYKVAKETERLEELQKEVVDVDNELFASKLAYRQVQRENEDELREIKQEISEKQSENPVSYTHLRAHET